MRVAFGSPEKHGLALPDYREVPPEHLPPRADAVMMLYQRAEVQTLSGGMGGAAEIGIGYRERAAMFEYHGITDPATQDLIADAFSVIVAANAEGSEAGRKEREAAEKRKRKKGKAGGASSS